MEQVDGHENFGRPRPRLTPPGPSAARSSRFFRQSHPDKELLIVDGASRDETLAIVRTFPAESIVVVSEPDRGIYDAMNKGLAAYSGDAVGFLNSDDCFKDADVLAAIAGKLEEAEIVHGNIDFVAPSDGRIVRRWRGSPHRAGAFARGWMPPHPAFYVRRAVVDKVGRFDLRYRIGADYDFMLRAMELNEFRSAFLDRVVVDMANGGESTSGVAAYLRSNLDAWRSRREWLGAAFLTSR